MSLQLIWLGLSTAVMGIGVNSNRWELYGSAGLSFMFFALNYIPDMLGIIALPLCASCFGRMIWCWLGSRTRTR